MTCGQLVLFTPCISDRPVFEVRSSGAPPTPPRIFFRARRDPADAPPPATSARRRVRAVDRPDRPRPAGGGAGPASTAEHALQFAQFTSLVVARYRHVGADDLAGARAPRRAACRAPSTSQSAASSRTSRASRTSSSRRASRGTAPRPSLELISARRAYSGCSNAYRPRLAPSARRRGL